MKLHFFNMTMTHANNLNNCRFSCNVVILQITYIFKVWAISSNSKSFETYLGFGYNLRFHGAASGSVENQTLSALTLIQNILHFLQKQIFHCFHNLPQLIQRASVFLSLNLKLDSPLGFSLECVVCILTYLDFFYCSRRYPFKSKIKALKYFYKMLLFYQIALASSSTSKMRK